MTNAYEIYKPGERKALMRLTPMQSFPDVFDEAVLASRDVLKDSDFDLSVVWSGIFWHEAVKEVVNNMGVLFEDAGRSQNPHVRTKKEQNAISMYVKQALRAYVRVRATISAHEFKAHMKELAIMARTVATAARWAVQGRFPRDPIFVGPIVEADVVLAALRYADDRFTTIVSKTLSNATPDLEEFSWGPTVKAFYAWSQSVKEVT